MQSSVIQTYKLLFDFKGLLDIYRERQREKIAELVHENYHSIVVLRDTKISTCYKLCDKVVMIKH